MEVQLRATDPWPHTSAVRQEAGYCSAANRLCPEGRGRGAKMGLPW